MTTIIYNHETKEIGVDGRCTNEDLIISDKAQKYKRVNGVLFFVTGVFSDFDLAIENYFADGRTETIPQCTLIAAHKDGRVFVMGYDQEYGRIHDELSYSIGYGSGGLYALSALDFGATTRDAVKYAISRDCKSGGKIKVFKL